MGFAAPLVLLGLLAGLLPVLVHRVRRRDLPHRPLPTLVFLQRAVAAQRAKTRLDDLLLLLLRIALVIAACLAAAAPYVNAHVDFGDGRVSSVAIVVDDSLSMMRRDRDTRLLATALERAREVIEALPDGSELSVVLSGAPARVLLPLSADRDQALRSLAAAPDESHRGDDLQIAAQLATQELAGGTQPVRHLLVLSDFARHARLDVDALQLPGLQVSVERVGDPPSLGNLAFGDVSAAPDPTTPGKTSVAFEVIGHGTLPGAVTVAAGEDVSVEVPLIDGRARGKLHLPTPDNDSVTSVRIESEDALPEDNVRPLRIGEGQAVELLLVNGDPQPASTRDELWYARHALRLLPDGMLPVRVSTVDAEGLERADLARVDVVWLANVVLPSGPTTQRIERFVRAGGGLAISAGDHLEPQRYNARLESLLPAHISARAEQQATGFEPSETFAGLEQVSVRSRLRLEPRGEVLLRFADGLPAVVAREVGRGSVVLLATAIDADGSDLPLRPGFMPLLATLLRHASRRSISAPGPHAPGSVLSFTVPPGASRMELVTPGGFRHAHEDVAAGAQVTLDDTLLAGAYRAFVAGVDGPVQAAPALTQLVLPPASEVDLTPGELPHPEATDAGVEQSGSAGATVERDLTAVGFLFVGLLVVAEAVLRRRRTLAT